MRSLNPWPLSLAHIPPQAASSLSLQFVLQEVLDISSTIEPFPSFHIEPKNILQSLTSIMGELEKLLVFSLEHPFAQKRGMLDGLCFYFEILIQACQKDGTEMIDFLDSMRSSIMYTKTKIMSWKKTLPPFSLEEFRKEVQTLGLFLKRQLKKFFQALDPYFSLLKDDENVLAFFIENIKQLNCSFGPRTVEDLLQNLFPEGKENMYQTIKNGYHQRGFVQVFERLEPLIDAISWEVPCSNQNMS